VKLDGLDVLSRDVGSSKAARLRGRKQGWMTRGKRSANFSESTKRDVALASFGMCNFEGCSSLTSIVEAGNWVFTGNLGHIHSAEPEGPRHDPQIPLGELKRPWNAMLLCTPHHTLVDNREFETKYPAELLKEWKRKAEARARELMERFIQDVDFAELDLVCEAVVAGSSKAESDANLDRIAIERKIVRNALSGETRLHIQQGLAVADVVKRFIDSQAMKDAEYPQRLVAGFKVMYFQEVRARRRPDEIFSSLRIFAIGGLVGNSNRQAAGLAVLAYLFQLCEVFES
jgi:hypothetical protein